MTDYETLIRNFMDSPVLPHSCEMHCLTQKQPFGRCIFCRCDFGLGMGFKKMKLFKSTLLTNHLCQYLICYDNWGHFSKHSPQLGFKGLVCTNCDNLCTRLYTEYRNKREFTTDALVDKMHIGAVCHIVYEYLYTALVICPLCTLNS